MASEVTRTFVAIEMSDEARADLSARVSALAPALPGVRFAAPDTWHVTLAFLGEITASQLAAARHAARVAATGVAPFALRLGAGGYFGDVAAPRVVWVGLEGDIAALGALRQRLVAALDAEGLTVDGRFTPHITLARPRGPLAPDAAAALHRFTQSAAPGATIPVAALSVMKSDLATGGARYTCLELALLG